MAKIDSYVNVTPPVSGGDKLIGTDVTDNNATKNFTVSQLITYITSTGVYVPYTEATANVDLGSHNIIAAQGSFYAGIQTGPIALSGPITISSNSGTSGQVLTSNGSGAPTWQDVSIGYKVYTAKISQSGTSAPTVDFTLKNTFTNPFTWNYVSVGKYTITNTTFDFTSGKTIVFVNPGFLPDSFTVGWEYNSDTQITIHVKDKTGSYADGLLFGASIEVRVYN